MVSNFQNTLQALKTFQDAIACARCEKSQKDLQFLGTSCKHAFCWDCVSQMTEESNKKKNISILCPRCAMQLAMNKISGATILNNCFEMLTELDQLIKNYDSRKPSMTQQEICCTQRIFADFQDNNTKLRTVDEFLLTQPADLDNLSEERQSSCSPELGDVNDAGDFNKRAFEKQKEEQKIKEEREKKKKEIKTSTRSSLKRERTPEEASSKTNTAKRLPQKVPFDVDLFSSQIPTKSHDQSTLVSFVNRRSTAPSAAVSGMVSMFAEPLKSTSFKEPTPPSDDLFTKKIVNTRRTVSATVTVKKEEILSDGEEADVAAPKFSPVEKVSRTRKSHDAAKEKLKEATPETKIIKKERMPTRSSIIKKEEKEMASTSKISRRSSSPGSFEKPCAREPRRSSLGTRRGEVVIINSILQNRIPQLRSAIEAGTCVNEKVDGKTPLFVAVEMNNLEAVKILIEAGALINANCLPVNETVLHEAVKQGNLQIADYLLSKGASMKVKNSWQKTPEDIIDTDNLKMKTIFDKHKNNHVLQPVIPPRRPIIMFVQLVEEKSMTDSQKNKLPGKINLVSSEMDGITHVVVDVDPKTKVLTIGKEQLPAILKAIIKPGLLVSSQWLKACIQDPRKVDEDHNYIVNSLRWMDGDIVEKSFQGWKKTDNRMNPKLFAGCKFFFLRAKYSFLDRPTMVEIVRAGGGQVFPREPLFDAKDPPPYHNPELKPNFVVYSLNHEAPEKYRDRSRFTLVCEQWLIDAILKFSISSTPY